MEHSLTAQVTIDIEAPLPKVWDALTNPEMIQRYLFGTETITSWKVGEPIVFRGEWEGKPYEDRGKIIGLEKEKELRYTYWSGFSGLPDVPENYTNIKYVLSHKNFITTVTVTQDNCRTEQQCNHSEQNWKSVMSALKNILESDQK